MLRRYILEGSKAVSYVIILYIHWNILFSPIHKSADSYKDFTVNMGEPRGKQGAHSQLSKYDAEIFTTYRYDLCAPVRKILLKSIYIGWVYRGKKGLNLDAL